MGSSWTTRDVTPPVILSVEAEEESLCDMLQLATEIMSVSVHLMYHV